MSRASRSVHILGGGPAGLAAGLYARRGGWDFSLLEAAGRVGGNCRTLRLGPFRFDTGAHRFHDKDPEVTAEVRALLGDDLLKVNAPSQIYWNGKYIDFPLSPYDLATKLDGRRLLRITAEVLKQRLGGGRDGGSFRDLAVRTYGETLAGMFLLNYSKKLWGEDTGRLSPAITGNRLRHLDLRTFVIEALFGKARKNAHLDGSFYYPRRGIGTIFDRLADTVGRERIRLNARVTGLDHDGRKVTRVRVNGAPEAAADAVLSTLPLTLMLGMLEPAPPSELIDVARSIRYRHLVLGVFCIDRPRLTENASIYFPNEDRPYTRIYESKNRSAAMAPRGQTAIVVEVPCQREDEIWTMSESRLRSALLHSLADTELFEEREVLDFRRYAVPFAYPILEVGIEEKLRRLMEYLDSFENLYLLGRSARFRYTHIHDMFRMARETMTAVADRERRGADGSRPQAASVRSASM